MQIEIIGNNFKTHFKLRSGKGNFDLITINFLEKKKYYAVFVGQDLSFVVYTRKNHLLHLSIKTLYVLVKYQIYKDVL